MTEVLVSPDPPEAFLGECKATADPKLCLVGFLSPAADASDMAAQVFDGIFNAIGAQEGRVERRGNFQAVEGDQLFAGFLEAVTGLLVLVCEEKPGFPPGPLRRPRAPGRVADA